MSSIASSVRRKDPQQVPDPEEFLVLQKLDYLAYQLAQARTDWAQLAVDALGRADNGRDFEIADNYRLLAGVAAMRSADLDSARKAAKILESSNRTYLPILREGIMVFRATRSTVGQAAKVLLGLVERQEMIGRCRLGLINGAHEIGNLNEARVSKLGEFVSGRLAAYQVGSVLRSPLNLGPTYVIFDDGCKQVGNELLKNVDLFGQHVQRRTPAQLPNILTGIAQQNWAIAQNGKPHPVVVLLGSEALVRNLRDLAKPRSTARE